MADLFGIEEPPPKPKGKRSYEARGFARRPGSGPTGETCKTCVHCTHGKRGGWAGYKCAVIKHRWTRSPATDITLKSPACEAWEKAKALGGGRDL
jgi:hypothetical protein